MVRDSERQKTYEAEWEVRALLSRRGTIEMFGTQVAIPDERKFGTVEAVQAYVDAVMEHLGKDREVTVRKRKSADRAHYERLGSGIAGPDHEWALREMVILHELAHHFTSVDVPSHGQEFRKNFCDLAEKVLAPEARVLLQVAFGERGLKV